MPVRHGSGGMGMPPLQPQPTGIVVGQASLCLPIPIPAHPYAAQKSYEGKNKPFNPARPILKIRSQNKRTKS